MSLLSEVKKSLEPGATLTTNSGTVTRFLLAVVRGSGQSIELLNTVYPCATDALNAAEWYRQDWQQVELKVVPFTVNLDALKESN